MGLRAALFDMDGLLLDTERVGMEVFMTLLKSYDIEPESAAILYKGVVGTSHANTRRVISDAIPGLDIEALDQDWSAGIAARLCENVPLRPSVRDALDHVANKGAAMAVVTTTRTDRARHHLEVAGLLPYFRDVIGVDRVRAPKPDPAPYMMGAAILGEAPTDCAAFEDSDTGTTAATRAGCQAWQIPDLRPDGKPLPELGQRHAKTLLEAVQSAF